MNVNSLGKISVAAAGTPVQVSTDTTLRVNRIRFAVVIGQTGRIFLGSAGMNKTTGVGVIKEFWPTGAGGAIADAWEVADSAGGDTLRPSDFWVDANTSGEGLMVSYCVR